MGSVSSTKGSIMPSTRDLVNEFIAKDSIVIFSKTYCPYCKMAKKVYSISHEIDLDFHDWKTNDDVTSDRIAAFNLLIIRRASGIKKISMIFLVSTCLRESLNWFLFSLQIFNLDVLDVSISSVSALKFCVIPLKYYDIKNCYANLQKSWRVYCSI